MRFVIEDDLPALAEIHKNSAAEVDAGAAAAALRISIEAAVDVLKGGDRTRHHTLEFQIVTGVEFDGVMPAVRVSVSRVAGQSIAGDFVLEIAVRVKSIGVEIF